MKNLTYIHYLKIINKIKSNPYLYVSTFKEARKNLIPDEFILLQNKLLVNT